MGAVSTTSNPIRRGTAKDTTDWMAISSAEVTGTKQLDFVPVLFWLRVNAQLLPSALGLAPKVFVTCP